MAHYSDIKFSDVTWQISCVKDKEIFTEKLQTSLRVSNDLICLLNSYKNTIGLSSDCTSMELYYKLQEILDLHIQSQVKN